MKINVDYAGRATTNGVVAQKDLIAEEDGSVVRNLRRAGAVIIGRTNTPCFSMRPCTGNDLHGETFNPHGAALSPGGSSGGAGSATAAGVGALGHGNDIGGSVRIPAYCNGIYGLRPTSGVTPAYNPSQAAERPLVAAMASVQGPLARSVEDIRLAMLALQGHDPRDVLQAPTEGMFAPLEHRPCRVAMHAESEEFETDPAVSAAVREAGAMLAEAGYEVVEAAPPSLREATEFWRLNLGNEMRAGMTKQMELHGDERVRRAVDMMLEGVEEVDTRDGFVAVMARRATLLRKWQLFLEEFPLLLTAVYWISPPERDFDVKPGFGPEDFMRVMAPMTATPTIGLPGLTAPVGTKPGRPMGVQLISSRFGDRRLLEAGATLERAIGRIEPIDPRP